jgi:Lon protease-like protein
MPGLLPLFPLQLVAFPGSAVPLHIFEERYKEMVGEAERKGAEFGIVLARDGGIVNAGCTVVVERVVERYPDGRFDVVTRGRRRFEIVSLDQELAYLRGEVEFFDDEDLTPPPADLRERAMRAFRELQEAVINMGGEFQGPEPDPQHPTISFRLAEAIDDLEFQNTLLRSRSEIERLRRFTQFTQEFIPRKMYSAKMKKLAPLNGSGHKPADL